ncbi:MAG: ABC transporter ATP-binding protein, partial [Candidatus Avispirillum sp.]
MLELKNIKKSYTAGDTVTAALDGVSLTFGECEFVAILGTSGSGKTTLLNVIGGLDCYDSGDLIINGTSTKLYRSRDWDTYRNHSIGFVFQSYNLIPHQSVLSNVELALTLSGVPKAQRRQRAKEALEQVGLGDQLKKKPSQMSGGQMQRVAIARALVNDPDILLADEPTGALDTATSVQIMELLREIAKTRLIIMVTHNPELAKTYATRIVRLSDGKVISDEKNIPTCPAHVGENAEKANAEKAEPAPEKRDANKDGKKRKGRQRTSMSFFTALSLSLNNLMTKKARTILTSFAGSIGIIGIALILAISSGIQAYIDKVQEDTLSGYPVSITEEVVDMDEMLSSIAGRHEPGDHGTDKVYESAQLTEMFDSLSNVETGTNNLKDFKVFLDSCEELDEYATAVQYSYDTELLIYGYGEDGEILKINPSTVIDAMYEAMGVSVSYEDNSISSMAMDSMTGNMSVWSEIMPDKDGNGINDLVKDQYDVVSGSWPESYDQVVLVIDQNNEISDVYLYSLGLKDQSEISGLLSGEDDSAEKAEKETASFEYDDLIGKKFYAVLNADKYADTDGDGVWTDMSDNEDYMKIAAESGIKLTVSGIVKPNPDATGTSIRGAIGYTAALTKQLIIQTDETEIVRQQKADETVDVFTGLPFKDGSEEPSADEKAGNFKEYVASLDTAAAAELYTKIAGEIPEDTLNAYVNEAMQKYPDRAAMEDAVVGAYAQSSGASEDMIRGYISDMSDEELEEAIRKAVSEQVSQSYAENVKAQLAATPSEALATLLKNTADTADTDTLAAYCDKYMPSAYSDSTYKDNMKKLGSVDIDSPSAINIYAVSFEAKDN